MAKPNVVYLCVWSGDGERARDLVSSRYPGIEIIEFPHRRLRISRFRERIRLLRGFHGRAIVFHFQSLDDFKHREILECFHFLHRCQETVMCDTSSSWESIHNLDLLRSIPQVLLSILLDIKTAVFWWIYLRLWPRRAIPSAGIGGTSLEAAYLIPTPANIGSGGGAISHIRGFLSGVKAAGITCRVFSGTALAQDAFENEIVTAANRPCFFWGAAMLSYNFDFARGVQSYLGSDVPRFFYQRHCAFSIAGALLSRRLKVPLILEYNGSEAWIADHWDPNPLRHWIKLCEEVTLRCATRIIVVSEALREDLVKKGIQTDRIRVNPNAVDPDYFFPGRGGDAGRRELSVKPDEVLIGFVGSFSLWHGIEILQQAIVVLLSDERPCRLRFVLMGDGLLHGEMRAALATYEVTGDVIFTGPLTRDKVAEYLDASDILVSPHIPMPDGSRFFGSPTKLFEYMAMGKAIVASRLEQLAEVLEHDRTAWLVTPGDVNELAEAILRLALDPAKREVLGAAARCDAVERHSWARNVSWALSDMAPQTGDSLEPRRSSMTLPRPTGNAG
jgi:glycosyltransferase involved in cell wall biosynthesis